MKKHISYPKITRFRDIVSNINRGIDFIGLDDNGNEIYDPSIKKPTLIFMGTVKLYGINASVCYNKSDGFWVQSRKNIITPENDKAGFALFAESKHEEFKELLCYLLKSRSLTSETITIYGEWAGKGVQQGVGISEVDKSFYIFGAKISKPGDENFINYFVDSSNVRDTKNRIFNVKDYRTYIMKVDFNIPQLAQNEFIKITKEVERECPIAKEFGINGGLGAGIIWSTTYKGNVYRFKETIYGH